MPKTVFEFPDQLDLTHFISAEAHDLRSPFNRILGFTKLVLKGMDGPLTDMQKEDLTTVYANSAQALNMMNSLVDAARLGLKEKEPNLKDLDINNLVGQAVSHWQQHHPARQVQIETNISDPAASLRGDEALLRQLLAHCITYVCAFVKDPASVSLQAETNGPAAVFTLHSVGEPPVEMQAGELTLIGYICRAILALHGGRILRGESDDDSAVIQIELPV